MAEGGQLLGPAVKLLDGGMGTELSKLGVIHHGDPLWCSRALADNVKAITAIHKSYIDSGADVITTCSYQVGQRKIETLRLVLRHLLPLTTDVARHQSTDVTFRR